MESTEIKNNNKNFLKKESILIMVFVLLISGLVGFYAGRFYERHIFRKRFDQMRFQRGQNNRENLNGRESTRSNDRFPRN
jgi:hypothetical protein